MSALFFFCLLCFFGDNEKRREKLLCRNRIVMFSSSFLLRGEAREFTFVDVVGFILGAHFCVGWILIGDNRVAMLGRAWSVR